MLAACWHQSEEGSADARYTFHFRRGVRGRPRLRLRKAAAVHLVLLLVGCTAAVGSASDGRRTSDDDSISSSRWLRWLHDITPGFRRAATDWGVEMDADWKTDIELCSRKQLLDAFFQHADADESGTLSQEEFGKACAAHREQICEAWEIACRDQADEICAAEWERTCIEDVKKMTERLAIEQNVFYEMGSRPVISETDSSSGLISGDGEITLAEFRQPVVPYISG